MAWWLSEEPRLGAQCVRAPASCPILDASWRLCQGAAEDNAENAADGVVDRMYSVKAKWHGTRPSILEDYVELFWMASASS